VIAPLHEEIARLAAVNATEEERERVKAFITEQAELKADAPAFKDFLRAARAWETLLGEVCGNPVLALYLRILIDLVATLTPSQDIYIGRPARAKTFLEMRTRIALAIVEGDAELAALTTRRSSEATLLWMKEDLGSVADWQAAKLPAPVDS
jgi:DNA-binding GntR family transcriptional regulator